MTAADRAEELLASDDEPTRLRGVHVLRDAWPDRGAAAARLVRVLADPGSYVPHAARAALQDLGADAVPALLDGLSAEATAVRAGCAWALAREHGAAAPEVLAALGALAADPVLAVREAVAGALGRIDADAAARERALLALLGDAEPRVRTQAVQSLGELPGLGPEGIAGLADALEDGRPAVRGEAALALRAVPPAPALRARVERALDEEPSEHVAAPLRALLELWRAAP